MKRLCAFIISVCSILFLVQVPTYAKNNSNDFYENFFKASEKSVTFGNKDVTQYFLDNTKSFFANKDYDSIKKLEKEGYVLCYSNIIQNNLDGRATEQKVKKYLYKGINQATNYSGEVLCDWRVEFFCKYHADANTGKVTYIANPELSLVYGVISNVPGTVILDNQSAYIKEKGITYVKFGYKFTIAAYAQFGVQTKYLKFITKSGVEKL